MAENEDQNKLLKELASLVESGSEERKNLDIQLDEEFEHANLAIFGAGHDVVKGLASDHVTGDSACKHCIQLVARHELHTDAFPVDPKVFQEYVTVSNGILEAASAQFKLSQEMLGEAQLLLKDPIKYINDKLSRYIKWGAILGTPIVVVIAAIANTILQLVST